MARFLSLFFALPVLAAAFGANAAAAKNAALAQLKDQIPFHDHEHDEEYEWDEDKFRRELEKVKRENPVSFPDTRFDLRNEKVLDAKVTVLSDGLSGWDAFGDWGYSAFVELDTKQGKRYILFDVGWHKGLVLENIENIMANGQIPDWTKFENGEIEVVLSHWHSDHTRPFIDIKSKYPKALGRVHYAKDFFRGRYVKGADGNYSNLAPSIPQQIRKWYVETYGQAAFDRDFVEHTKFSRVFEDLGGVWLTAGVRRNSFEKNYPRDKYRLQNPDGSVGEEDNVPDDMALVINTAKGWVVLSGCGHSGLINILDTAYRYTGVQKVHAVIGGLHMRLMEMREIVATSWHLMKYRLDYFIGGHCTGIHRVLALRNALTGLNAKSAVISSTEVQFSVKGGVTFAGESPNIPFGVKPKAK
jgi:7,8-dihydropterin-6-yl-methyl-4-(beta-D-ribofuranosyl)aminobenzene 5'-phosphate synthase